MENPYQTACIGNPILNEYYFFYVPPPVWNDCIIKIFRAAITAWLCVGFSRLSVKKLLLILAESAQIIQETSRIEFEVYFPPQLNLENAKNSMDVEDPHHYNIFFWECYLEDIFFNLHEMDKNTIENRTRAIFLI